MVSINLNNSLCYWSSSNDSSNSDADGTKKTLDENTSNASDFGQPDATINLKQTNSFNSPFLRVRRSPQFQIQPAQTYDSNTPELLQILNQSQESTPVWTKQVYDGWNAFCTPFVKFLNGEVLLNSPQEEAQPLTDIIEYPFLYISCTPYPISKSEEQWSKQTSDWSLNNPAWVDDIPNIFEFFYLDWKNYINRNLDRNSANAEVESYFSCCDDFKNELQKFQTSLNELEKEMAFRQEIIKQWKSWINNPSNFLLTQNNNKFRNSIIEWQADTNKKLQDISNVKEKIKIGITNLEEVIQTVKLQSEILSMTDDPVLGANNPKKLSRFVIDNNKSNDITLTTVFFNNEQETRIKQQLNDFFSNEDNKEPSIKNINKLYQCIEQLSHEAAFIDISRATLYKEIVQTDEEMNQFICRGILNCNNVFQFIMDVMYRNAGAPDFNLQKVLDEIETKINAHQDNERLSSTIKESIKNDIIFYIVPTLSPDYIDKRKTQNPNSTIKMDSVWVKHNTVLALIQSLGINPTNISLNELSIFWGVCEAILTASNLESSTQKEAVNQWQSLIIQTLMMSSMMAYVIDDKNASKPINTEDIASMQSKAIDKFCDLNIKTRQQEHPIASLSNMLNGYKTRTELGTQILQNEGLNSDYWMSYYKNLSASANRVMFISKAAFEVMFHPGSWQQILKINSLPNINKEFDEQNEKIAEQYKKVDTLLLISGLSTADKEDISFIQNATSIITLSPFFKYTSPGLELPDTPTYTKYHSMPDNYVVFSATQNDGRKKYFSFVYEDNKYKLKTMSNKPESYQYIVEKNTHDSLTDYTFHLPDDIKITGHPLLDKLLQYIVDKHKTEYNAKLHDRGYEATLLEKTTDFLEAFIPFRSCFNINSGIDVETCTMDILLIGLPFAGNILSIGFNLVEESMIDSFAESISKEAISKNVASTLIETGINFPNYFSKSLSKELILGILNAGIDALDPGFRLIWTGTKFIKNISKNGLKCMGDYLSEAVKETEHFLPKMETNSLSKLSNKFSDPQVIENIQKLKQRGWKLGLRGGGAVTSREATEKFEEIFEKEFSNFKKISESFNDLNRDMDFTMLLPSIKKSDVANNKIITENLTSLKNSEDTFNEIFFNMKKKITDLNQKFSDKDRLITKIKKKCKDDIENIQSKINELNEMNNKVLNLSYMNVDNIASKDFEKYLTELFKTDVKNIENLTNKIQKELNEIYAEDNQYQNIVINPKGSDKRTIEDGSSPSIKRAKLGEKTQIEPVMSGITPFIMPKEFNDAVAKIGIEKTLTTMSGMKQAGLKLQKLLDEFNQLAPEQLETIESLTKITKILKEKPEKITKITLAMEINVVQFTENLEYDSLVSQIISSFEDISKELEKPQLYKSNVKNKIKNLSLFVEKFDKIELPFKNISDGIISFQEKISKNYDEIMNNPYITGLKTQLLQRYNEFSKELYKFKIDKINYFSQKIKKIESYKIKKLKNYLEESKTILSVQDLGAIYETFSKINNMSKMEFTGSMSADEFIDTFKNIVSNTKKIEAVVPYFSEVESFLIENKNEIIRFEEIFKGNIGKIKNTIDEPAKKFKGNQKDRVDVIKKILTNEVKSIFDSVEIFKNIGYTEDGTLKDGINLTSLNTAMHNIGKNTDGIYICLTKSPRDFLKAVSWAYALSNQNKDLNKLAQHISVANIDLNTAFISPIQFPIKNGPTIYSTGHISDKTLLLSDVTLLDDSTYVAPKTKIIDNQFHNNEADLTCWNLFPLNDDENKYLCLSSKAQTRVDVGGLVKYIKEKEQNASITILSGVHGAKNGNHWEMKNNRLVISPNGADQRIIEENNNIAKKYSNIETVDIATKSPLEIYEIINTNQAKYIIATHCYGLNDTKLKEMFNFNTKLQNTYMEYTHYLLSLDPDVLMNEFKLSPYFKSLEGQTKMHDIEKLVFSLKKRSPYVALTEQQIDLFYKIFNSLPTDEKKSIVYLIRRDYLQTMIDKKYTGDAKNNMLNIVNKALSEKKPSDAVIEKYINNLRV